MRPFSYPTGVYTHDAQERGIGRGAVEKARRARRQRKLAEGVVGAMAMFQQLPTHSPKGDILIVHKAQASEFPSTEVPRRQKELERRGYKSKVEPV